MKPDRSNYEIWLTDWMDGNLSQEQADQLMIFLNNNPDLIDDFDLNSTLKLNPGSAAFNGKEKLRKNSDDLSQSQLDQLSIAFLENDLDSESKSELLRCIDDHPEKRESFDLIQKLKLSPQPGTFARKKLVARRPRAGRILWLSGAGLTAAATIALLIIAYFRPSALTNDTLPQYAGSVIADTAVIKAHPGLVRTEPAILSPTSTERTTAEQPVEDSKTFLVDAETADLNPQIIAEPVFQNYLPERINISLVAFEPKIILAGNFYDNSLIPASNTVPSFIFDDGRSNVERFLARVLHENILKDETKGSQPVKGYDIAEAGINGINKLMGWEMAFEKNTDEEGNVKSIYFSSKMIKFNAPVKKSGPVL